MGQPHPMAEPPSTRVLQVGEAGFRQQPSLQAPPGKGNLLEMQAKMSHTVSTLRGSFAERRALPPGCWELSSAGLISQLPHPALGLREEEEEEEEAWHSGSTGLSPPFLLAGLTRSAVPDLPAGATLQSSGGSVGFMSSSTSPADLPGHQYVHRWA